jgi:MFS superfamily sulfate permease-like transporter
MRRVDALAFLSTAISVLIVNAVAAVVVGCCFYGVRYLYHASFVAQIAPSRSNWIKSRP